MTKAVASVNLSDICRPKQWPTISKSRLTETGYPVFGANGRIGYFSEYNHEDPTILITCRGATCGTINVCEPKSYVTGNAMALDDLDASRAELRYTLYALRHRGLTDAITGTAQPQITRTSLSGVEIPLPPLPEQKRIADILDKADAVRRKTQEVKQGVASMRRSLFIDLFGEPASNDSEWSTVEFEQILKHGMRNGISPSRRGTVVGKVLVLSAITGSYFDPAEVKQGTFDATFNEDQLVDRHDFLICRGNGNKSLVGSGHFPTVSLRDTVFPDTMIAARIDPGQIEPSFLEEVWSTGHVRRQIESGARTTNGTHKVNQKLLATISFPLPPIDKQRHFAQLVSKVNEVEKRLGSRLPDDLFNSLVQRAFKGEL